MAHAHAPVAAAPEAAEPPPPAARWLLLSAGFQPRAARFAGGDHGLWCAARALAARGGAVHLLYPADRAAVALAAIQGGFLAGMVQGGAGGGVLTWRREGVTLHAVLRDGGGGGGGQKAIESGGTSEGGGRQTRPPAADSGDQDGPDPGPLLRRLLAEAAAAVGDTAPRGGGGGGQAGSAGRGGGLWVVVDSDGAQRPLRGAAAPCGGPNPSSDPAAAAAAAAAAPGAASLLEAAVARWGRRVVVLVQNAHFLPFGPEGTAPRAPGVLRAWAAAGGAVCPSRAVAEYVTNGGPLPAARVCVVPYAAWGAYGGPDFEDVGARVAAALWQRERSGEGGGLQERSQEGSAPAEEGRPQGAHGPPRVLALKLNREKGSDLFLALARRLPALRFLAVTGDGAPPPAEVPAPPPPNLEVVAPVEDVGALLARAAVAVVPSVWHEAWGMVAVDAALRGVPVLVSDRGGLPEAGLGAAAVLPVRPMVLPLGDEGAEEEETRLSGGSGAGLAPRPSWRRRQFPQQPPEVVDAWAAALRALLLDKGCAARYAAAAAAARGAAATHVAAGPGFVEGFYSWLGSLPD